MMTSTQVVETSINVITNSPSQDYTHPDDHNLRTNEISPYLITITTCSNIQVMRIKEVITKDKMS